MSRLRSHNHRRRAAQRRQVSLEVWFRNARRHGRLLRLATQIRDVAVETRETMEACASMAKVIRDLGDATRQMILQRKART